MSRASRAVRFALALSSILAVSAPPAQAQGPVGTAFTYQGRLTDAGVPSTGNYDLRFTLFDSATGPGAVGDPIELSPVPVSGGLFNVSLDFGAGIFTGSKRWLEIEVKLAGGAYTTLSPRQELTPTPNAVYAATAGSVSGTIGVQNGGTGSAVQNFVDLTTPQTVGGDKTLTGNLILGPSTPTAGNIMKGGQLFIHSSGVDNTFIGEDDGNFTMTGAGNTASGVRSLFGSTSGNDNTATGAHALAAFP